jgi:hypothetical protein
VGGECSGTIGVSERDHRTGHSGSTGPVGTVAQAVLEVDVVAKTVRVESATSQGGILSKHVVEARLAT